MAKIVIDARESGTSTGRYVDKLIEHLHKLHPPHDITVLTKPHRLEYMRSIAPNFMAIESPYKEFTFSEQIPYLKQLRELKADLIHFSMVQQPVLYTSKVVTTIHDLIMTWERNPKRNFFVHWVKQQVYKWVIRRASHKSKVLIVPSEYIKKELTSCTKINPDKIFVTYEAADFITDTPAPLPSLQNEQFIMYIGRPMPHKNLDRLIEAFQLLQSKHPSLHLVLAGKKDANYQRIEQRVQAQGIKQVVFTDFITDGQLRWLYENCAAYVFPSLSEGFGLPGLEAMVHGAPVVSSNATCLPEIYGEAAHYFDPTDTQAMATAIEEVLSSEKLREDLISKGKTQAAKYSWQRMAEQTLTIYQQVLKNTSINAPKGNNNIGGTRNKT